VLIGEIGGTNEQLAAHYLKSINYGKPVFAYIAGVHAPPGKKMGHAGAIIEGKSGSAETKIKELSKSRVKIAKDLEELNKLIIESGKK